MDILDRMKRFLRPRAGPGGRDSTALALQGGGALGAFTWGVLDRLLEAPAFRVAGLSGASAGAVNAVVMAAAWAQGGAPAARAALDLLWQRVGEAARLTPFGAQPFQPLPGFGPAAGALALDVTTRFVSPYQFNPLALHPLREILAELVDFTALAAPSCPKLVIAATRIADGTARLFGNAEITLDAVLASAALPSLNHAVEIDGEAYWDGGYAANPPLRALVDAVRPDALLVVQLNPLRDDRLPRRAPDIVARLNQIVFNRPLLDELAFLAETRPDLLVHRLVIDADHPAVRRGAALSLDPAILQALREHGREQASAFLASGLTGR